MYERGLCTSPSQDGRHVLARGMATVPTKKCTIRTMWCVCEMHHSIARFRRIGTRESILGSAHLLKHMGGVLYETAKLPLKGIAGAAGAVYDTAKHGVCPPCTSPPPPEVSQPPPEVSPPPPEVSPPPPEVSPPSPPPHQMRQEGEQH